MVQGRRGRDSFTGRGGGRDRSTAWPRRLGVPENGSGLEDRNPASLRPRKRKIPAGRFARVDSVRRRQERARLQRWGFERGAGGKFHLTTSWARHAATDWRA